MFLLCCALFSSTLNPHSTLLLLVVRFMAENLYHKLVLSLRSESQHSDFSSTKPILKKPLQRVMTPKKQPTIGEGTTTLKGKSIVTAGGIIPRGALTLAPLQKRLSLHLHRGQPEIFTSHQHM